MPSEDRLEAKLVEHQRGLKALSNVVFQLTELVDRKLKGKVWNHGVLNKLQVVSQPVARMWVEDRYDTPKTPYMHVYMSLIDQGVQGSWSFTLMLSVGGGSRRILGIKSGAYSDLQAELKAVETFDLGAAIATWNDYEMRVKALKATVPSCIIDAFYRIG